MPTVEAGSRIGSGGGSRRVCPHCGQPLREPGASRLLHESSLELARVYAEAGLAVPRAIAADIRSEGREREAEEPRPPGESGTEAVRRSHDLRVQLRIF